MNDIAGVTIEGITNMNMPITLKLADGTPLITGIPLHRLLLSVMASVHIPSEMLAKVASVHARCQIGLNGLPTQFDSENKETK